MAERSEAKSSFFWHDLNATLFVQSFSLFSVFFFCFILLKTLIWHGQRVCKRMCELVVVTGRGESSCLSVPPPTCATTPSSSSWFCFNFELISLKLMDSNWRARDFSPARSTCYRRRSATGWASNCSRGLSSLCLYDVNEPRKKTIKNLAHFQIVGLLNT